MGDVFQHRPVTVTIDEDYPVRQRRSVTLSLDNARKIRDELVRMTLEGEL